MKLTAHLAEIEKRLDAATPGPWVNDQDVEPELCNVLCSPSVAVASFTTKADGELIANTPADLRLCLSVIEEMRAALENCKTALADSALADAYKAYALRELHDALARVDELCGGKE